MAEYEHLQGKAVEAITGDEERVRGVLLDFRDGPMLHGFDGTWARWERWVYLAELPLDRLTRDELLDWHHSDPLGYLKAGYEWLRKPSAPAREEV